MNDTIVEMTKLKDLFLKYKAAYKVLSTKFEIMYDEFENRDSFNPIEHVKGRIKKIESIEYKLKNDGYVFNSTNIENIINDVVGIRIVCYFKNDLDTIINLIRKDPQLEIIKEKNYIENPKDNGYQSHHLIVKVPIVNHNTSEIDYVKAEIQVRTIAMDLGASLEHRISYKKDIYLPDEKERKIIDAAHTMMNIDDELEKIINNINKKNQSEITQESLLYDLNMKTKITDQNMYKYKIASDNLKMIINSINDSFELSNQENPIEHIKARIKSPKSIYKKLTSLGLEVNETNIDNHLSDVVGIRIVCAFLSDLDKIIEKINETINAYQKINGIEIVRVKDYIANPKQNGYSSYHIIVRIPVYLNNKIEYVNAEIQIRTKAMNIWSSFEHKLCYKKRTTPEMKSMLKEYHQKLSTIDEDFNEITNEVKVDKNIKKRVLIPQKG